jgi:hypothetical protein
MNFTMFGGRRFVMAMGAGIMTTALQWFGKLDSSGATYALVIIGTVGAYITAAVVDNIKAAPPRETST